MVKTIMVGESCWVLLSVLGLDSFQFIHLEIKMMSALNDGNVVIDCSMENELY